MTASDKTEGQPVNKGGRPKKPIDERGVLKLARIGCTLEEIAAFYNTNERVVRRRFSPIIKVGHSKMRMSVRRNAFKRMMEGNVPMTIFLCKAVCGMRDNEPATIIQSNKETKVIRVFGAYERHAQAKDGK